MIVHQRSLELGPHAAESITVCSRPPKFVGLAVYLAVVGERNVGDLWPAAGCGTRHRLPSRRGKAGGP